MRNPIPFLAFSIIVSLAAPSAQAQDFWCGTADMNGDGVIGGPDLARLGQCWLEPNLGTPLAGFLGFSNTTLNGGRGFLTMNSACVDTFGVGAFMCPSTAFAMQPIPVGVTGDAWVQPVFAATSPATLNSSTPTHGLVEVVSGLTRWPAQSLSCDGWQDTNPFGLRLRVAGSFAGFTTGDCAVQIPVACCRLPQP